MNQAVIKDELADFSTDRRVLLLSLMALVIGGLSSLTAYVLLWLIAAISIDPFELARVGDVMDKNAPTILSSMKLSELSDLVVDADSSLSKRQGTLIVNDQNELVGIITRGDIVRGLRRDESEEVTVIEAGSTDLAVAFADEPLRNALSRMLNRDIGRLPVVERENQTKIVGYLGRAAILSARMKMHEEENIRQKG
jgi:CIC family chloride channel protein